MKILIVDDNYTSVVISSELLKSFGFISDFAQDADGVIEKLQNQPNGGWDLLLMDWDFPGKNCIDICRYLSRNSRVQPVPKVILMTAYGRDDAYAASLDIDLIVGVLAKPIMPSTLLDTIFSAFGKETKGVRRKIKYLDNQKNIRKDLEGIEILLVEDTEINQEVASELLSSVGIIVTLVEDGQSALDVLEQRDFDGVLMDCQLPVKDSYEAARELRQQERFKDLPVIAMTENVLAVDREKSLQAGMDDHIGKPVNPRELFSTLKKWIHPKRRDTSKESADSTRDSYIKIPEIEGLNTESGLSIVQHNQAIYIRLLYKFSKMYTDFKKIFMEARLSDDHETAIRCAHSLKGSAGNIGAEEVQDAAFELEKASKGKNEESVIDEKLQGVFSKLEPLIIALKGYIHTLEKNKTSTVSFQRSPLYPELIEKMRRLLEEDDAEAVNLLDHFIVSTGRSQFTPGFKRFVKENRRR